MFAALIAFRNGDEVNKREGGGERLSIPPHLGFSSLIVDLYLKNIQDGGQACYKEIISVYFSRMSMYSRVVAAYILYDLN